MSDEESPEKTGRRTRSGRTVKAAAPITSRTTRRTRRTNPEPEPENVHEEIPEETPFEEAPVQELLADDTPVQATIISPVVETPIEEKLAEDEEPPAPIEGAAVENLAEDAPEGEGEAMVPPEDEKSSSFPFGEQSSADREDMNNINRESGDNLFIANLAAEENANSLPSGTDDNEIRDYEGVATNSATLASEVQKDDTKNDSDDCAIAEDLPNGQDSPGKQTDPDTEMVSEDELPAPTQPKVQDAEEVSDDELPGPKLAELPADTEVVSEDELPAAGKGKRKADEGYDPGSPTESTEAPEKKAKIESVAEEPKKKLPDLDKYWKAVNDDPTDFTAWTYLLQYVDQEVDIEAAREAYDAFLAHYPYCYGYWRKYADYEKRRGNKKKCEEVFERGLKAIPLSVDLWIHYLGHVKGNYGEDESFVRSQFERALGACGLEFRSDKLWEAYIKWETEGKRVANVVSIYDRLLCTPTQGYNGHFDSFSEIVSNNAPQVLVTVDEFKRVRREVRDVAGTKSTKAAEDDVTIVEADKENVEKNEDSEKDNEEKMDVEEEAKSGIEPNMKAVNEEKPEEVEADDHVANDEEAQAIKDKILSIRRKLHKQTVAAVTARWVYEEAIKRPYFHVKPLERCQLKNWKDYLDYEIEQGDRKRVLVLFERCLIACALYEEFWLKLIRYLESQNDAELAVTTRDAFERACTVHHPDKPSLHLMWSAFEEVQNNYQKAAEVLTNLEKVCPNLLQVAYRRINLERRRGDYVKCSQLYEHYIGVAKGKNMASSLAIKYARFCHKVKGDLDGGMEVLKVALEKDSSNTRIALQMIDLALQRAQVEETEVVEIMDSFMAREGMDAEQKVLFAQRKVEFLEDFGSTARGLQDAQRELQLALAKANESKKKASSTEVASAAKKSSTKDSQPPLPTTGTGNSSTYSSYNYSGSGQAAASGYYGSGATAAQSGYGSYTDANYGYNHWNQYGQTGYSGYSQWSGYGNYY
ncbi:pre-mRNA-processing factor 39 [Phlebotomus argentipes]|uniref:pre-mRNA-processing factor 39 n=1 Tax=Phlebotomus argentipes TaxID=94469 RepID=UPI002893481B|nr:pre-mRNA-processing factor 39 [Phlebotomus argentipes]